VKEKAIAGRKIRLIEELNRRGLPTYSSWGRSEVAQGVLVGFRREDHTLRRARRTGMLMQEVLEGAEAGEMPVQFNFEGRLTINIALVITIAVELVAAQKGLGGMIWFAWETLRTEELYAGLIVIAALGIGFNLLLQRLMLLLVPWKPAREP